MSIPHTHAELLSGQTVQGKLPNGQRYTTFEFNEEDVRRTRVVAIPTGPAEAVAALHRMAVITASRSVHLMAVTFEPLKITATLYIADFQSEEAQVRTYYHTMLGYKVDEKGDVLEDAEGNPIPLDGLAAAL